MLFAMYVLHCLTVRCSLHILKQVILGFLVATLVNICKIIAAHALDRVVVNSDGDGNQTDVDGHISF
jgi:hypothetical protein